MVAAGQLLDIYSLRLQMSVEGVTHPPLIVVETTRQFVEALRKIPANEPVEFMETNDGDGVFTVHGVEIGRIPDTRNPKNKHYVNDGTT